MPIDRRQLDAELAARFAPQPNGPTLASASPVSNIAAGHQLSALNPRTHSKPTRADAHEALRTLLAWIGEDPTREGLLETPDRVLRAYGEFFAGYGQDPAEILGKTFDELAGYSGPVVVRDIEVQSHCEHHMVPFQGIAHVAYLPDHRVVGLSKLARLVEAFARRLQIQERLTAQIAHAIERELQPRGVAVVVACEHQCMAMRGVRKAGANTVTTQLLGVYEHDADARAEILRQLAVD